MTTDNTMSAGDVSDFARSLNAQVGEQATLDTVCEFAQSVLLAEQVSITMMKAGRLRTVAATGDVCRVVDQLQFDTGEGPCVEAATSDQTISCPDLATEDRWPTFGPLVASTTSIRSLLAHAMVLGDDVVGSINLFSSKPQAFSAADTSVLHVLAAIAALEIDATRKSVVVDNLEAALKSSRTIGTAIGIIMSRTRCTAQDGFDALRRHSQDTNTKLHRVAQDVVGSGDLPDPRRLAR